MMREAFEDEEDYYIHANDYAALEKRLAETEAIAKQALATAPAHAEEVRRLGREVVAAQKALDEIVELCGQWLSEEVVSHKESQRRLANVAHWIAMQENAKPHAEVSGDSGELKGEA
jgi:hypothetical protein